MNPDINIKLMRRAVAVQQGVTYRAVVKMWRGSPGGLTVPLRWTPGELHELLMSWQGFIAVSQWEPNQRRTLPRLVHKVRTVDRR